MPSKGLCRCAPHTEGRPSTGMLCDGDTVWRSVRSQSRKDWIRGNVRGGEERLKAWRCVRRILQLMDVTRTQTRVKMEKNLRVKEILGEIWTVQTRWRSETGSSAFKFTTSDIPGSEQNFQSFRLTTIILWADWSPRTHFSSSVVRPVFTSFLSLLRQNNTLRNILSSLSLNLFGKTLDEPNQPSGFSHSYCLQTH